MGAYEWHTPDLGIGAQDHIVGYTFEVVSGRKQDMFGGGLQLFIFMI